jgi:YYY domain-containing protein
MGWPLGLVAFAGVGWVLVKAILRRASSGELILLSWIVPYFGVTGLFLAKFMRYMIPVVPLFVLMGAGMLVGERRGERGIRHALTVIALGGAIFWSLAFVNGVYRTEHTWILASRWIYDNLPDGSVIGSEHWDDDLPLDLPEPGKSKGARKYRLVELPMYEEDTEEKYNLIRSRLRECDYIVLASNRLYRSIPRLPQRYPMTTKYYELLFSGQLGFEKVAEFTTYPKLGPFVFCDDDADESFTVYDHPKPIVFKKVRELSDEEWEELLGGSWVGAIPGYVGKPTLLSRLFKRGPSPPSQPKPEEGKTLLLSEPVDELPIVNDFRWNSIANRYHIFAIFFFWLVVELIGFAAWPFAFVVFRSLSDRGYILAKSLGLLAISYVVWLASSIRLLKNTLSTAILALSLLSLLSLHLFRRNKGEMTAFWKSRKRLVLFNEAFFSLAFLAFVVIRLFNPDLWQPWFGGEKMMEFAFLNAILKSAHFPPYDPYFAGGYLNYYYYGQFIVAVLIKLTGIMPSVAFNLAVPTLFALTVGNAFCVGYNLAGGDRRGAMAVGLLSSFFVAIIGNLASMVQIVVRLGEVGGSDFRSNIPLLEGLVKALPGLAKVMLGRASIPGFDYWWPSRVIPKTINEFPFWSFLFADLHPHMIGMPFTILVVALAFEIARGKRRVTSLFWAVIPLSLGAVTVINTWDFPTYFFIIACALLIKRLTSPLSSLLPSLLSLLSSLLLYWPFFAHYKALFVGIGFVKERTELGPFLAIWGFFFFVLTTFLLVELMRQRSRLGILRFLRLILGRWDELPRLFELYNALVHKPESGYILALRALSLLSILVAVLILLKAWVIALLLPFTALAALLLLRREASREELFTYLLVFTGLLILLGCEVFYLKDFLSGGEWRRMNTIFKFHIQAWVLLGLAMGSILPRLLNHVMGWRSAKLRVGWIAIFAFLLLSSSLFLPLGVPARVKDRFPGERPPIGTLDGMAYMTVGSYTWPEDNRIELKYDYEAIKWLLENVKGTPVIAEAVLPYYREGGLRVSSYTGLPTLLGAHQSEQRYGWQVGERDKEAREFFNTADIERALQIIRGIRISYIYIGQLERTVYDPAGLGKFERMVEEGYLEVVFENERVRIYRVI